jgi:hypothetical protein
MGFRRKFVSGIQLAVAVLTKAHPGQSVSPGWASSIALLAIGDLRTI